MPNEQRPADVMQKLVSLCKQRGFVFQSSEIYGGLKSAYDYGPLGVELKRNLMNAWWDDMVTGRDNVVGLDASIIMHPKVWHSSGHAAGFADPPSSIASYRKNAFALTKHHVLRPELNFPCVVPTRDKPKHGNRSSPINLASPSIAMAKTCMDSASTQLAMPLSVVLTQAGRTPSAAMSARSSVHHFCRMSASLI